MPVARTFIPDPSPSPHPQASPDAEHTNLPADASVWAAARRSYVEDGLSCPVVAERHGLHRRTVSRHALAEDWAAQRARHMAAVRRQDEAARAEAALDDPAAELVADLRARDEADLLLHPSGAVLIRNAARRVGEAMAAGRMLEARGWSRVLNDLKGAAQQIDDALLSGQDVADRLRTAHFRGLHDVITANGEEAEDGPGGSAREE